MSFAKSALLKSIQRRPLWMMAAAAAACKPNAIRPNLTARCTRPCTALRAYSSRPVEASAQPSVPRKEVLCNLNPTLCCHQGRLLTLQDQCRSIKGHHQDYQSYVQEWRTYLGHDSSGLPVRYDG